MGHLSPSLISTMSYCQMVKGLEVDSSAIFDYLCSSCIHRNFYKLPLLDFSFSRYSKIKLLMMDLTGPMFVPT